MLAELKKLVIGASGGYAQGLWLVWEDTAVWRLIEAIELVAMVRSTSDS